MGIATKNVNDEPLLRNALVPFFLTIFLFFIAFLLTLVMSLPSTVVYGADFKFRKEINSVAAQQFAFFTKDPKSEFIAPFSGEGDSLLATPQGDPNNLYGLSRKQRAQGPEISNLANKLTAKFHDCGPTVEDCFRAAQSGTMHKINNTSPIPTACGEVVLIIVKPIPYEYRNEIDYMFEGSKSLKLLVDCDAARNV